MSRPVIPPISNSDFLEFHLPNELLPFLKSLAAQVKNRENVSVETKEKIFEEFSRSVGQSTGETASAFLTLMPRVAELANAEEIYENIKDALSLLSAAQRVQMLLAPHRTPGLNREIRHTITLVSLPTLVINIVKTRRDPRPYYKAVIAVVRGMILDITPAQLNELISAEVHITDQANKTMASRIALVSLMLNALKIAKLGIDPGPYLELVHDIALNITPTQRFGSLSAEVRFGGRRIRSTLDSLMINAVKIAKALESAVGAARVREGHESYLRIQNYSRLLQNYNSLMRNMMPPDTNPYQRIALLSAPVQVSSDETHNALTSLVVNAIEIAKIMIDSAPYFNLAQDMMPGTAPDQRIALLSIPITVNGEIYSTLAYLMTKAVEIAQIVRDPASQPYFGLLESILAETNAALRFGLLSTMNALADHTTCTTMALLMEVAKEMILAKVSPERYFQFMEKIVRNLNSEQRAQLLLAQHTLADGRTCSAIELMLEHAVAISQAKANPSSYINALLNIIDGIAIEDRIRLFIADTPRADGTTRSVLLSLMEKAHEISKAGGNPVPHFQVIGKIMSGINPDQLSLEVREKYRELSFDTLKHFGSSVALTHKNMHSDGLGNIAAEIDKMRSIIATGAPFRMKKIIEPIVELAKDLTEKVRDKRSSSRVRPVDSSEDIALKACRKCLEIALPIIERSPKEARPSEITGYTGKNRDLAVWKIKAVLPPSPPSHAPSPTATGGLALGERERSYWQR